MLTKYIRPCPAKAGHVAYTKPFHTIKKEKKEAMKISLVKILIIVSLFSCGTNKDKIQKVWIGKYEVQHSDSKGERINETPLRQIIQFNKDSFIIKRYPINLYIEGTSERISQAYKIQENQILTSKDTFNIQNVFSDSLIISFDSGYTKRIVYEELERYNQAERADELMEFLTSNTFTTQEDTIKMEFRKNRKYVSPSFNFGAGSNQFWMIDTFEDELFLVFDGFLGAVIQITNFNSNQIRGKVYYKDNIEITWNKFENEVGFNGSQLIGEWEKIQELMPPPPVEDEEEYYNKEILKIGENKITRYEGFRKDTVNWEFNRGKNIIIFPNYDRARSRLGKQWNIMSIEKDTLTLKRRVKSIGNWNSNITTDKFKRKK